MVANDDTRTDQERRALEHEREQTAAELERLQARIRDQPDSPANAIDLDMEEREKNMALVRRLETRIDEIDNALCAMRKGNYGICERCGRPIEPGRLKAMPEATLCIRCKKELESQAHV